jgi:hypothetical protein
MEDQLKTLAKSLAPKEWERLAAALAERFDGNPSIVVSRSSKKIELRGLNKWLIFVFNGEKPSVAKEAGSKDSLKAATSVYLFYVGDDKETVHFLKNNPLLANLPEHFKNESLRIALTSIPEIVEEAFAYLSVEAG